MRASDDSTVARAVGTTGPSQPDPDSGAAEAPALSAEQAAEWRARQKPTSPVAVVAVQAVAGLSGVAVVTLVWGWVSAGMSMAWGVGAVVLPSALMAWGLRRPSAVAAASAVRFFAWEWAKLALSVVLMVVAPLGVPGLNWPALLAGVFLAVKAQWLALLGFGRRASPVGHPKRAGNE